MRDTKCMQQDGPKPITLRASSSILPSSHSPTNRFSARRPGEIVERVGVASPPSISFSTPSITGPSYKPNAARRKRPRVGEQFTPRDDLSVRASDVKWLQQQEERRSARARA
jgi:hypothetical protein